MHRIRVELTQCLASQRNARGTSGRRQDRHDKAERFDLLVPSPSHRPRASVSSRSSSSAAPGTQMKLVFARLLAAALACCACCGTVSNALAEAKEVRIAPVSQ